MNSKAMNWKLKQWAGGAVLVAVGLFLGWILFAGSGTGDAAHSHDDGAVTVWTCSMHPQIRQQEAGLCPICAMDLIPLEGDGATDSPGALRMTEEAVHAASIRTAVVESGMPFMELRLPGKVQPDESRRTEMTARVSGRVEQLFINTTGQQVRKGQRLMSVYSPELVAAQQELLEAKHMQGNGSYLAAARRKLRFWDLTDEQIRGIEESGEVRRTFDLLAPHSGTVLTRHISTGDYVREGQALLELADLSRVWVQFDAYERDLTWVREGMTVRFTVSGQTGSEYSGRVSFIDPVIDAESRVARVRVEMPNPAGKLKPEMFVSGLLKSMLPGADEHLVVPSSAVLWTGTRSVVWVRDPEKSEPVFHYREVELGAEVGDSYIIESGLVEGEHIVVNGVFTLDAAAQLQGKASMMNAALDSEAGARANGKTMSMDMESITRIDAPLAFQKQLKAMFLKYEEISAALVASNAAEVTQAVAAMREFLGEVRSSRLSRSATLRWAELQSQLRRSLTEMRSIRDLEKQRAAYEHLSTALFSTLAEFGVEDQDVFTAYCPMAFDDKGAYWLTSKKEIRNPYFGDAMLKCGVIKGKIGQ